MMCLMVRLVSCMHDLLTFSFCDLQLWPMTLTLTSNRLHFETMLYYPAKYEERCWTVWLLLCIHKYFQLPWPFTYILWPWLSEGIILRPWPTYLYYSDLSQAPPVLSLIVLGMVLEYYYVQEWDITHTDLDKPSHTLLINNASLSFPLI